MSAPPVYKEHTAGTHRKTRPEETLARISGLARRMGITRVATITGLDTVGIPVVAVVRPASRSISVAQGKGLDLTLARISGLMESVENFHAERVRAPLTLASWEEMCERRGLLDISRLPRAAGGTFDPRARILWIEGHEALRRRPVWLPFEIVHTDYTLPLAACSGAFLMSDSGVASGNHPLEAVSHAICELIERDAVTLWHFAGEATQRETRIELESVDDAACRALLGRFARAGVQVAVWEVTSDVGIPAFLCKIADAAPNPWRPLLTATGTGCHPCPSVALSRALTEAAQVRLTVIAGTRDDIGLGVYRGGDDRDGVAAMRALMAAPARRPFLAGGGSTADTLNADVSWELACLERAGIQEVAIVDLTLPEYGIPVVRVVIPGLEGMHDAAGFVAGHRLRSRRS